METVFSTKVGESEKVKDGERQREDRYSWIVEGAKGLSAPCLPGINHGISDAQPLSTCRSCEKHLPRNLANLSFVDVLSFFAFRSGPSFFASSRFLDFSQPRFLEQLRGGVKKKKK